MERRYRIAELEEKSRTTWSGGRDVTKEWTKDLANELLQLYFDEFRSSSFSDRMLRHPGQITWESFNELLRKGIRLARTIDSNLALRVRWHFLIRCNLYPYVAALASRIKGDPEVARPNNWMQINGESLYRRLPEGDFQLSPQIRLIAYESVKQNALSATYFVQEIDGYPVLTYYHYQHDSLAIRSGSNFHRIAKGKLTLPQMTKLIRVHYQNRKL